MNKIRLFLSKGVQALILFLLFFMVVIVLPYSIAYYNRVLPGVWVAGVDISQLNAEEAYLKLSTHLKSEGNIVTVSKANGLTKDTKTVTLEELGVAYNLQKTAQEAFNVGRRGNIINLLKENAEVFSNGKSVELSYDIDKDKLDNRLRILFSEFEKESKNARFAINNDQLVIEPEQIGEEINKELFLEKLLTNIKNYDSSEVILTPLESRPTILTSDLEILRPNVENLMQNQIIFKAHNKSYPINNEALVDIIKVENPETGGISLNSDFASNYLVKLGEIVNIPAKGGNFREENGRVVEFSLPTAGESIDVSKAIDNLANTVAQGGGIIELAFLKSETTHESNKYGINALLGEGFSTFHHSIPGRINNVELASKRTNGVLVAPGEDYSFNDSVGEISARTGYDTAYIIENRRTVLGTGGGVCQVSTTVYRAALWSGLSITKRYAHAYRVGYYEPPGLDATVYAPVTDLRFKNDTPGYILVMTEMSRADSSLKVSIYGQSDGRKTDMSDPLITSISPAPAPIYEDDPSLPPGVIRQIDFAANGANVQVTRKVTRGDEILVDEVIKSFYAPWQAVYKRGVES